MAPAEIDILVVGSGVAGLSAALEAAREGCSTLVVESEEQAGGASIHSGGACCIVGTPLQAQAGIHDSVDLAMADWQRCGGDGADLLWARRYLACSHQEVYRWCEGLGITWRGPSGAEGNSVPRLHEPVGAGRAVVDALLEALRDAGVLVLRGTRVRELVREDGRITGAVLDDGAARLLRAHETVMCAGGFVNAPDLLSQHVPAFGGIERVLQGGWRSARGLGLTVLAEAGAAFTALDRVWMYPVGTPNPGDTSGRRGLVVRGLQNEIWVDRSGRRFHDETLRGGRSGIAALLARPGQTCWGICDVEEAANLRLLDDERYGSALGSTASQQAAFFAQSDHAWSDEPLAALAARLGLPAAALTETVLAYNRAIAAGVDRDHGRDLRRARPIDETRACAVQYFPIVQKNLGGVLTDGDGRVLDSDRQPIPGLLAAGEVAGMAGGHLNGDGALEGTMFGPSLFSGRIAGRTAALQPARA